MKKVLLIVIVALMAASLMAGTAAKLVRLEVINASGDVVEGMVNDGFYYLTIADGDAPTFTVVTDVYKRTTWACGYKSSGKLVMTSQVRLKFTQCDVAPPNNGEPTMEKVSYYKYIVGVAGYAGCGSWLIINGSFKAPTPGCYWRYRY